MYVATLDSGVWYDLDAVTATLSLSQTDYPFRQPGAHLHQSIQHQRNLGREFWIRLSVGLVNFAAKGERSEFQLSDVAIGDIGYSTLMSR